jgi:signal transduction histidine kinase/ActR/RegA family two-component response regulator
MTIASPSSLPLSAADTGVIFYVRKTLAEQRLLSQFVVFLTIFLASIFNQHLFYNLGTSPANIFVPTGISLAAIYFGGYRMAIPIGAAWLLGALVSPGHFNYLTVLGVTIGYPLQAIIGGYVLKRFDFDPSMAHKRSALLIILVALFVPTIAPTIVIAIKLLTDSLQSPLWANWTRAWAGGVMNILVLTPLITTWGMPQPRKTFKELIEILIALSLLVFAIYITFWTALPTANTFVVLYALFAILFWIGLRMRPRFMMTSLFIVIALGMAGSIFGHPTATAINTQLLADELFMLLIAPIFLILSVVVEEQRNAVAESLARAKELEILNQRLCNDDQTKSDFIAILAHELRNPLAPIVSSIELAKMKLHEMDRGDIIAPLESAEFHTGIITRLLDDLLDVVRISKQKFVLQKEPVELQSIINASRETVEPLYESRNQTFWVNMPKRTILLEADKTRLQQILVNLLVNAGKYTKRGGKIELSVTEKDNAIEIKVSDNGIGIPADKLDLIFEPFIQIREAREGKRVAGLGIGLALAKELVELHEGTITVESAGENKGSTFTITLPQKEWRQNVISMAAKQLNERVASFSIPKETANARSILIVDDNEAAAQGLKKLLQHNGHSVSLAYSGTQALNRMREAKRDVVILDIGMPDMNGYMVAEQLRMEHGNEDVTLIALTGYGQEDDKLRAKRSGFNFHLTKPIGIADLERILSERTLEQSIQA